MPLTSTVAILAALATAPSPDFAPLPAICIATAGPTAPAEPARWRNFLPTIVLGLDHQPRRSNSHHLDGHLPYLEEVTTTRDGADHSLDDSSMTRWTISLRWRSGPAPNTSIDRVATTLHGDHCHQLAGLYRRQPAGLTEYIDHWTESARIHALLHHATTSEVDHD